MKHKLTKTINKKNVFNIFGGIAFLLTLLFLVSYLVSISKESNYFFQDSAKRSALIKYEYSIENVENIAKLQYDRLYEIAKRLQYATSKQQVTDITKEYISSVEFGDLRYYSQNVEYDANGVIVTQETSGHELIAELASSNMQGCTKIYYDSSIGRDCIAFFVPVRGSSYVDGLLSIIAVRGEANTNQLFDAQEFLRDDILSAMIVDRDGKVFTSAKSDKIIDSIGNDIYSFVSKISTENADTHSLAIAIGADKKGACIINGMNAKYVFIISPIKNINDELLLVLVTEQDGLIASEMNYIRYVITLVIIALAALLIGIVYAYFYYKQSKLALDDAMYTDPVIGCPNSEKFRITANSIIKNKQSKYAITILEFMQFHYFAESLSPSKNVEILKHIAKVIDTFCNINETYGYLKDGKFAMLIHCRTESSIRDKIKIITAVLRKNETIRDSKAVRLFNVGVALGSNTEKHYVQELINNALLACQSAQNNINLPYIVFNEEVNIERMRNEKIELEMEYALANGDFKLYLQPKYNIKNDKIDSAEALVRWFDPKTGEFRMPGEFISLFETNGFIAKLDRFMYIEVLKYLQSAMEKKQKQVPISVNVSLVTASEKDFLEFYVENKKKYGIADDYVTLEFTESFLADDYQQLSEIVQELHKNGILCSLDDFGTGYASFNVLKNIEFDELKLDKELLKSGANKNQDDAVLSTIVNLAKTLNIKVVQEGVEDKETFDKVARIGCEVIQGYYYAKAISVEEYKIFINSNTSIKYKSLIK